jgi:hypothetical protein
MPNTSLGLLEQERRVATNASVQKILGKDFTLYYLTSSRYHKSVWLFDWIKKNLLKKEDLSEKLDTAVNQICGLLYQPASQTDYSVFANLVAQLKGDLVKLATKENKEKVEALLAKILDLYEE